MKNEAESDVVAELKSAAHQDFNNWLNSPEVKESYLTDLHALNRGSMTLEHFRTCLQHAFYSGAVCGIDSLAREIRKP